MKMLACGSGPLCPTHLRKILGDPVLGLLRKQPYCGSHKFTVQTCVTRVGSVDVVDVIVTRKESCRYHDDHVSGGGVGGVVLYYGAIKYVDCRNWIT